MTAITRLISSDLALARDSAALISCWATQICCCLGLWNFLAALRCRSETPLAAAAGGRKQPHLLLVHLPGASGQRGLEDNNSELHSRPHLLCRLLLEKNKNGCSQS